MNCYAKRLECAQLAGAIARHEWIDSRSKLLAGCELIRPLEIYSFTHLLIPQGKPPRPIEAGRCYLLTLAF
jgi:hypothetical protein